MPPTWIGLTLAFVSALVTNTAYSLEHDAAAALPPLSPRRPFRSMRFLLRDRRWLIAFGAETAGWLMYVAALRLAPLALVQAVAASGVAVLAFATARGHPSRLARREQFAVLLALAGLTLLAFSLTGTTASDQHPPVIGVVIWLAACAGGAVLLIAMPTRIAAMGRTGTEVAKEAATMILTDDNFATIVRAVREGRGIYDNIVNFTRFQVSTAFGFVLTFLVASMTGIAGGAPFAAVQILFVNLVMDGPPAMSLGVDPVSHDAMRRHRVPPGNTS